MLGVLHFATFPIVKYTPAVLRRAFSPTALPAGAGNDAPRARYFHNEFRLKYFLISSDTNIRAVRTGSALMAVIFIAEPKPRPTALAS